MPETLETLVYAALRGVIKTQKSMQHYILQLREGLEIRTTPPIQTTDAGKRKFSYGYETAWLIFHPKGGQRRIIAEMQEGQGGNLTFKDFSIGEFQDLIIRHLSDLQNLAVP